jgi:hypothetical protein
MVEEACESNPSDTLLNARLKAWYASQAATSNDERDGEGSGLDAMGTRILHDLDHADKVEGDGTPLYPTSVATNATGSTLAVGYVPCPYRLKVIMVSMLKHK